MDRIAVVLLGALVTGGCQQAPPHLGVVTNQLGIAKTMAGPSPADLATRDFVPGTLIRMKRVDVTGDEAPQVIVALPDGAGVEIRDQAQHRLARIPTQHYLTDFGTIRSPDRIKPDLVLLTYPDERGGGTFDVVAADGQALTRWQEFPSPGRFSVGVWNGEPAVFYLRDDTLMVRSAGGASLAHLVVPGGSRFRDVLTAELASHRLAVVASGNGSTPYHMVCVFDDHERLAYQEVSDEHAYVLAVEEGGSAFVVSAQSQQWRYAIAAPAAR